MYNVRENPLSHELYLEKRVEFSEPNKVYGDTNTKADSEALKITLGLLLHFIFGSYIVGKKEGSKW